MGRRREVVLAWSVIALSNLVVRGILYSFHYRGVSLFCGDSAHYVALARGTPPATADRPSGFPYVLRFLLAVADSPEALLAISTALAVAAQILCWRLLSPRHVSPLAGAVLTSVLFLDPVAVKMTSMVFMADTLAVLLLCLALVLLLPEPADARRGLLRGAAGLLVLGYLTIVKYSYLYVGAAAGAIFVFREVRRLRGQGAGRALLAAGLLLLAWIAIPATYAVAVNQRHLGILSLDNFGGRSMLATIAAGATCEQLAASAGSERGRRAVARHCRDEELARAHGSVLLWNKASSINAVGREIAGDHRASQNQVLRRMAVRLALAHPELVLHAIGRFLRAHLTVPGTSQTTVRQLVSVGAGCDRIVAELFGIGPEEYLRRWAEAEGPWLDLVDGASRFAVWLVNVLSLAALVLLAIARPARLLRSTEAAMLLAMTAVYAASATLGSPYDSRIAWVLDLLCALTVVVALSPARRMSKLESAIGQNAAIERHHDPGTDAGSRSP